MQEIARVMVVFEELNKIPLGPAVPSILVNISKKEIVSSIRTQKHKLYQNTVPLLLTTLSAFDYAQNLLKKEERYISAELMTTPFRRVNLLKLVPLRHMLPGRVFTFNSQLYFVYHEMAKLLQVEESAMPTRALADSIFGLSLVNYKN
jgi:hypothetical protein